MERVWFLIEYPLKYNILKSFEKIFTKKKYKKSTLL